MADYTVSISASTTMMIRDLGGWIEFWFKTGSQTWNNQQQWAYSANGGSSGVREFRLLRGGFWQHFGSVFVQYDQDVSFTVYSSVSAFPTYTFTQHITRTTVPQAPTLVSVQALSATAFRVIFVGNYDGGSPVTAWEIGYGTSSNGPIYTIPSDGDTVIDEFVAGQRLYFWARGFNARGWSAWSNRLEGNTWMSPRPPGAPLISEKTQVSVRVQYLYAIDSNDNPTLERQIGYGTDPDDPTDFSSDLVDGSNYTLLEDLEPGGTYYIWGRSRNSVGWSAFSTRTTVILIAGARVLVSNEWKRAVPYVRVDGVWKVAQPWVKKAGIWQETII